MPRGRCYGFRVSEPARKLPVVSPSRPLAPLPAAAEASARAPSEAERNAARGEYAAWADSGPGGPLTADELEAAERELASVCAD